MSINILQDDAPVICKISPCVLQGLSLSYHQDRVASFTFFFPLSTGELELLKRVAAHVFLPPGMRYVVPLSSYFPPFTYTSKRLPGESLFTLYFLQVISPKPLKLSMLETRCPVVLAYM